jgi:lipid II:glycine glycyltransferase (peptidoglycan interpeptide bridge formation enzyme)
VNYKITRWNLRKSPTDSLPKNTFFLDLTLSEEILLRKMKYKTRYNIMKGIKNGIQVKEYGIEHINDWYSLYQETAIRHKMVLKNEMYFATILKNQDNTKNGVNVKMLMAERAGEFLASMFLVVSKKGELFYTGLPRPCTGS